MNWMKGILSAVGGFLLGLLGNVLVPVLILVICNIIDYGTGIMASLSKGGISAYSSKRGFKGIAKKVCMLLLVAIALMLDLIIAYYGNKFGIEMLTSGVIAIIVTLWLIFSEMTSILENIVTLGVAVPGFLIKFVAKLKAKSEDAGEKITEIKDEKNE